VDEDFTLEVPFDLEPGVYSDRLRSWFTRHQLVLDFCAPGSDEAFLATARVRVPATAALEMLSSLAECIGRYELEFGEIHRPRRRGEEWTDTSE